MSKPTTHVLLVTDKSGSMFLLAADVRGGYNQYRQSLIDDDEVRYRVTSVLFADDYQLLCTAAKPRDVPKLDEKTYIVGGSTALRDAIGRTITDFEKAVPELGEGDRVLLVVQTDGHENSSREYSAETIKTMLAEREAKGWGTIYMGAGPNAWNQGGNLGFSSSLRYDNTSEGTQTAYDGLTRSSRSYAGGADVAVAAAASGLDVED